MCSVAKYQSQDVIIIKFLYTANTYWILSTVLLLLLLLSHFSRVRLFVTPWTAAYQAPPSVGFSWQEYWSWLPLPSPTNYYY